MYVEAGWRYANLTFALMPFVQLALHRYVVESPLWKPPSGDPAATPTSLPCGFLVEISGCHFDPPLRLEGDASVHLPVAFEWICRAEQLAPLTFGDPSHEVYRILLDKALIVKVGGQGQGVSVTVEHKLLCQHIFIKLTDAHSNMMA